MRPTPSRPLERIEPDPRRAGAVGLVVDGRTVLSVPIEAIGAERVTPGMMLSEALFARLADWADRDAAYRTALRLLERRPFAKRDLGRRLTLKGHLPGPVAAALERAVEAGLLDDERFARHFVQTRAARGRGPARLRRELAVQGVAAGVVERVLAEEITAEQSHAAMLALAAKRSRQLGALPRPDRVRRVLAYLARRGYGGSEVRRLVREAI